MKLTTRQKNKLKEHSVHHTKSGKIVRENPSTNRARQGSGGKPRKK